MSATVHTLDHESAENPIDRWRRECGIPSDNAAANALCVHRHTVANMRSRELLRIERLAMAAVKAKLAPWT